MLGLSSNKYSNNAIDFTIGCYCYEKVEMVQQVAVYTFIHLVVPKYQIMKSDLARMIVFWHEFDYKHINDMFIFLFVFE